MKRFKRWCDDHDLDWFGLVIGFGFFGTLLAVRWLG